MGDKDNSFLNRVQSNAKLYFAEIGDKVFKELPIVEDSVMCECDEMSVRDMATPCYTTGSYSFNLDNNSIDKAQLDKLLGVDIQSQIDRAVRSSVIIECGEYILRPKNLKYPNKKRARRIWKKWRRRFGVRPSEQFVIPRAVISYNQEIRDGCLYNNIDILAEKISE